MNNTEQEIIKKIKPKILEHLQFMEEFRDCPMEFTLDKIIAEVISTLLQQEKEKSLKQAEKRVMEKSYKSGYDQGFSDGCQMAEKQYRSERDILLRAKEHYEKDYEILIKEVRETQLRQIKEKIKGMKYEGQNVYLNEAIDKILNNL